MSEEDRETHIDRVMDELRKFWKEYPDFRLGQIFVNAVSANEDPVYLHTYFFLKDERLLRGLKKLRLQIEKRGSRGDTGKDK